MWKKRANNIRDLSDTGRESIYENGRTADHEASERRDRKEICSSGTHESVQAKIKEQEQNTSKEKSNAHKKGDVTL